MADDDTADDTDDTDKSTTSVSERFKYTNDILAGSLVLFAIGASSAFIYRGQSVPMWLYIVDSLAVVTAVVWAFGRGAFKAAKEAIGGGDS